MRRAGPPSFAGNARPYGGWGQTSSGLSRDTGHLSTEIWLVIRVAPRLQRSSTISSMVVGLFGPERLEPRVSAWRGQVVGGRESLATDASAYCPGMTD